MDGWELTWAVFGGAAVLTFAGLELAALKTVGENATLSATLRRWLGIYPKRRWAFVGSAAVVGFAAWIVAHLVLGIWP